MEENVNGAREMFDKDGSPVLGNFMHEWADNSFYSASAFDENLLSVIMSRRLYV